MEPIGFGLAVVIAVAGGAGGAAGAQLLQKRRQRYVASLEQAEPAWVSKVAEVADSVSKLDTAAGTQLKAVFDRLELIETRLNDLSEESGGFLKELNSTFTSLEKAGEDLRDRAEGAEEAQLTALNDVLMRLDALEEEPEEDEAPVGPQPPSRVEWDALMGWVSNEAIPRLQVVNQVAMAAAKTKADLEEHAAAIASTGSRNEQLEVSILELSQDTRNALLKVNRSLNELALHQNSASAGQRVADEVLRMTTMNGQPRPVAATPLPMPPAPEEQGGMPLNAFRPAVQPPANWTGNTPLDPEAALQRLRQAQPMMESGKFPADLQQRFADGGEGLNIPSVGL